MKKRIVIAGALLASVVLMAGGNKEKQVSEVISIPPQTCKLGTVYIEHDAKLMWQDAPYTDAEDGAYKRDHSVGKAGNWNHAVNYCRSLVYAGYHDWRLPTADELMHVHRKKGQVFKYYRDNDFWSSTPSTDVRYYVVYPADAYQRKRYKKESNYIRCVRCLKSEAK